MYTYAAPTTTYAAPTRTYAAPVSTYAAPTTTYAAPATYAAPTYAAPTFASSYGTTTSSSYGTTTFAQPYAQPYAQPQYISAQPQYMSAQPVRYMQAQPQVVQLQAQPLAPAPPQSMECFEATNTEVPDEPNFDGIKEVHALVCYCDYNFEPAKSQGWVPPGMPGGSLDTSENAEMIMELLTSAGVTDIERMHNLDCTKEDMVKAIRRVGKRCDSDDIFFFFYSGHGESMPDQDGDEVDGKDEAMCLPSKMGTCDQTTWLRDDDFCSAIAHIRAGQKLMVIDCCHSGTLCDFTKPIWKGQRAMSICGCRDAQQGAAMSQGSRGGAFSKAITHSVKTIGDSIVSVGKIHNTCLYHAPSFIPQGHSQDITINCAPGMDPSNMMWPLPFKG